MEAFLDNSKGIIIPIVLILAAGVLWLLWRGIVNFFENPSPLPWFGKSRVPRANTERGAETASAQVDHTETAADSRVWDIRDDAERRMEERARGDIGPDEEIARTCVELMLEFEGLYNSGKVDEADAVKKRIRDIGQSLWDDGGHQRMVQIAYRGAAIGRDRGIRGRDFEFHWDGVGDWMY